MENGSKARMNMGSDSLPDVLDTSREPKCSINRVESFGSYDKLGNLMGNWPEVCIMRRFSMLNVQNILLLQAELCHLEDELADIREEEAGVQLQNSEKRKPSVSQQSWYELSRPGSDGNHSEHYTKILQIRRLLQEYNGALLQFKELCDTARPTNQNLRCLRRWLSDENGGDSFLGALEADVWDEDKPFQRDLIALSTAYHQRDLFSTWLAEGVIPWLTSRFGRLGKLQKPEYDVEGGLISYDQRKFNIISRVAATLVAGLLPPISIFALYFIHGDVKRLGAIVAFSALFSFSLVLFTRATRIEIFAATAAYVVLNFFVLTFFLGSH